MLWFQHMCQVILCRKSDQLPTDESYKSALWSAININIQLILLRTISILKFENVVNHFGLSIRGVLSCVRLLFIFSRFVESADLCVCGNWIFWLLLPLTPRSLVSDCQWVRVQTDDDDDTIGREHHGFFLKYMAVKWSNRLCRRVCRSDMSSIALRDWNQFTDQQNDRNQMTCSKMRESFVERQATNFY